MAKAKTNAAKATKANGFENPYRVGGGYWASVEALKALGMGKMHDHADVLKSVKKAMGENWKPFAAKEGKLTADQRAMVNVMVTARDDYGAPVKSQGYHVIWDGRNHTAGLFMMSPADVKEFKAFQTAANASPAKAKPKAAKKAAKPQAKPQTPKKAKAK